MMNAHIAIVGGGASGLMAAAAAAESGARVLLLERMDRVGKKLLATGNGRCNLTHVRLAPENYHGAPAEFIRAVLDQCPLNRTLDLFEKMGLSWRIEADSGRIYPRSAQASSVLDVLRRACARLGVTEICGTGITRIERDSEGFTLKGKDGSALTAQKVILATGGRAAPGLGSNGSGYELARQAGHRIVPPFP
ncbi:MAG TPA: aminoacetone oxidase family FAD-binding enzyme, partial [bacterium]|nr:aminoacetone oxidase family FAD-binding enzyme [bacterium]